MSNIYMFFNNNIYFLSFLEDWLGKKAENSQGILQDIWRSLCLTLCEAFYRLFGFLYQLFIDMTEIRLLTNNQVEPIYRRITILLGLIMLFVITFYLIKLLLSPDKINDKEQGVGNLIKKIIVVIVLLGFTPKLFDIALDIQQHVVEEQVIPKIIIGKSFTDADNINKNYGRVTAIKTFEAFYKPNPLLLDEAGQWRTDVDETCPNYSMLASEFVENNTFEIAKDCLTAIAHDVEIPIDYVNGDEVVIQDTTESVYVIEFDAFPAVIAGIFIQQIIVVPNLTFL